MIQRLVRQIAYLRRHPLTAERPAEALGRFLAWQLKSRLQSEIEFRWIEGSKLLVKRGMTGATGNIYCGLHEFVDMAFVLHLLRPGDLFGDVGANIGSYTVLASAVCGARVMAVEPDPGTVKNLKRNVLLNRVEDRVTIAETAVGDREGSIRFTVGLDTMNKVSLQNESAAWREVPLTTLDRLFSSNDPIMLKLDVEGFEAEVLQGAEQVLARHTLLAVQSESRDQRVLDQLLRHGFVETHYNPFARQLVSHQSLPQSNGLFVRDKAQVEARIREAPRFRVLHHEI